MVSKLVSFASDNIVNWMLPRIVNVKQKLPHISVKISA